LFDRKIGIPVLELFYNNNDFGHGPSVLIFHQQLKTGEVGVIFSTISEWIACSRGELRHEENKV